MPAVSSRLMSTSVTESVAEMRGLNDATPAPTISVPDDIAEKHETEQAEPLAQLKTDSFSEVDRQEYDEAIVPWLVVIPVLFSLLDLFKRLEISATL